MDPVATRLRVWVWLNEVLGGTQPTMIYYGPHVGCRLWQEHMSACHVCGSHRCHQGGPLGSRLCCRRLQGFEGRRPSRIPRCSVSPADVGAEHSFGRCFWCSVQLAGAAWAYQSYGWGHMGSPPHLMLGPGNGIAGACNSVLVAVVEVTQASWCKQPSRACSTERVMPGLT